MIKSNNQQINKITSRMDENSLEIGEEKVTTIRGIHKLLLDENGVQSIYRDKKTKKRILNKWKETEKEIQIKRTLKWVDLEDIRDLIEQNKEEIRQTIALAIPKLNKNKKAYLNKFITKLISSLSLKSETEFDKYINYYLELVGINPWEEISDELWSMIDETEIYSRKEILEELFLNNILLPETKNQKDFDNKMYGLMKRLTGKAERYLKSYPVVIPPINTDEYLNYMMEMNNFMVEWKKEIDWGIIDSIWYNFDLSEMEDYVENNDWIFTNTLNNDCKFIIWFRNSYDSKVSRNTIIEHFNKTLSFQKINDSTFLHSNTPDLNFYIKISEEYFKPWITDEENISGFTINIVAEPRSNIQTEEYFIKVSKQLPGVSEEIVNDLYEAFWRYEKDWVMWDYWYPKLQENFVFSQFMNVTWDRKLNYNEDKWNWNTSFWGNEVKGDKELKIKKIWLSDLILNEKIKKELSWLIKKYKNRDFYLKRWWTFPNWILLFWLPWGWKTTIAKIIANESGAWFFNVKPNIQWEFVWQSENNLKAEFDKAKKHVDTTWENAIIFIDESENLFPARWSKDHKEWMMALLLTEMDWIDEKYKWRITYVFATNRKDILDPALLSRIDKNFEIPMPNVDELEKIIDLHIGEKMKESKDEMYEHSDLDIPKIAKTIKGRSGRFVMKLIKNAHDVWLDELFENSNFTITTETILWAIEFTEVEEKKDIVMWFKA